MFPPVFRSIRGQEYLNTIGKYVQHAAQSEAPSQLERLAFRVMLENDPESLARYACDVARQKSTYGAAVAMAACLRYGSKRLPVHPRFQHGKRRSWRAKAIVLTGLLTMPHYWRSVFRALGEW